MAISFNDIPAGQRVPFAYIEFDNSRAVQSQNVPHKIWVIGQRLSTGTVAAGVPTRIVSDGQAEKAFGRHSMLAEMLKAFRAANRSLETWAIALDDDATATAAAETITFNGQATESGDVILYVGDRRLRAQIPSGTNAATLESALRSNNNSSTSPVEAVGNQTSQTVAETTYTCRWKGESGNDIDFRLDPYGEGHIPDGLVIEITGRVGSETGLKNGTVNPSIAPAIAAMGDEQWNTIVMPYTDSDNLDALVTELNDRWGPLRMSDGIAYTAVNGASFIGGRFAAHMTFGSSRNDHLISCMGAGYSPTPPWILASVYAAVGARSLSIDPARPLQTLALPGVSAPPVAERWGYDEQVALLHSGISTYTVGAGGSVHIQRAITLYRQDANGIEDTSYLDVTTPATLSHLRYTLRARITQKFPRHKLADDGTRFGEGQAIVTPSVIRGEILRLFREWEDQGLVENFEQFKDELVVERNAADRNRIDVLAPPDLVNQLRVFAAQIQFIV